MERFTVKEAAEYLGVSVDSIYKMVRQKEIPHFRVRRTILLSKKSVDEWVAEQEANSINQ